MGKNKKSNSAFADFNARMEEQARKAKKAKMELEEFKNSCCHVDNNGKPKLENVGNNEVMCKMCYTKFSLSPITEDELKHSRQLIHNMIQQIKIFSNDPESEFELLENIGKIPLKLEMVQGIYVKNILKASKEKKNKNKNYNQYDDAYNTGVYGSAALDLFVPPSAKKKNKEKEKKKKKFY